MFKDMLVHVDQIDQSHGPLETAIHLAERFNAQLSGLHVTFLFHYVAAHDVWVAGLWEECKDELRAHRSDSKRQQRRRAFLAIGTMSTAIQMPHF